MKRLNKKGFTIVELVIVIAVIAILAATLIPTFSNVINKANQSADTQLVRNLNTILLSDKASGKNHETMQSALDCVADSGYDVAKIMTAKATDNTILWDETNDVFCYQKEDGIVNIPDSTMSPSTGSKLWKVYSSIEAANATGETCSIYLAGSSLTGTITVTSRGIDVGKNTLVGKVVYNGGSSAYNSIVRTNSYNTTLEVDALNDSVYHFGKVNTVNVKAVATSSYHENGQVLGNILLDTGRVVLEEGSKANAIYLETAAANVTSGASVVSADNTKVPTVPVILKKVLKEAISSKGGSNSIPNPQTENVIVLGDKVLDDQGTETQVDAVAYLVNTKKNYATIGEAIETMTTSDTLMLLKDVENVAAFSVNIPEGITKKIDLNGHNISFAETSTKDAMGISFEGNGTIIISNGTISTTDYHYGDVLDICCKYAQLNNVTINFTDEGISGFARWGAIYSDAEQFTLNGCTINAIKGPGIQNGKENGKMIINDSIVVSGDYSALYCGGGSMTEVNNSSITGVRAVHACTSGALFTLNSGYYEGSTNVIQLDNTTNAVDYLGVPNYVTGSFALVYGGNFIGNVKVGSNDNGTADLYVYGGTFNANVSNYRK